MFCAYIFLLVFNIMKLNDVRPGGGVGGGGWGGGGGDSGPSSTECVNTLLLKKKHFESILFILC